MNVELELELNILFENLSTPGSKKVAVIIGRFNPPTKGHYKVINEVKKFIRNNKQLNLHLMPIVIVIGGSKSDLDIKRNPLTVEERIIFMKNSGHADGVIFLDAKNAFEAFSKLREEDMEPIAIAAGSDRIDDYLRILDKHFLSVDNKPIKHYGIALDRDSDAVSTEKSKKDKAIQSTLNLLKSGEQLDVDLISGSLARRAVELGYEEEFAIIVGLEHKPLLAKKMFSKIKKSLSE